MCSFPACRNRGVKFRYCVFCRDPVAKRSFRNRHNHAGEKLEDRTRGDGSKQAKTSLYGTVSSCSTLSPSEDGSGSASSPDEDLPMKRCCEDSSRGKRPSKSAKVHDERMAAWELLLANRPDASKDKEITVWLDQVMLVSDARKPFSAATSKMKPCYYKKR